MSSVEADFDRLALRDDEGWTTNNHYHASLLASTRWRLAAVLARSRATQFVNLEFQLAGANRWDSPPAHFDFICSIATLHHVDSFSIRTGS